MENRAESIETDLRKYAVIDTTNLPLVLVTYKNMDPTLEEYKAYASELFEVVRNNTGLLILHEASKTKKYLRGDVRAEITRQMKTTEEISKQNVRAQAIIVSSTIAKIVTRTIFAIRKPAVLTKVFDKPEQGLAWLHSLDHNDG
ncbi:hypothetical protein QQ008_05340 [Fulvivirgaceae bacterium BMA10]|uniref:DUF7793 domain-containing protein n=2 Tax=Splendidivirga corallicola TaxID=3051826 RepID=A0ABT8KJ88_9BACT|nr:hypothetical protein [Fulvivirgaceae bacterium BMA10]